MTEPLLRRAAVGVGKIAARLMPARQASWACAMLRETAEIDDDLEALQFAAGCLRAALQASLLHLMRLLGEKRHSSPVEGSPTMDNRLMNPRAVGIVCAIAATTLGIAYMAAAGAPVRYMLMNAAALAIGLILLAGILRTAEHVRFPPGSVPLLAGSALLATALFGLSADGATRWANVASIALQPSLILLPLLILAFARRRDALGVVGVGIAACALALQPDRAMAGVLAASLAALVLLKPDRWAMGGLAAASLAFLATLLQPDALPASPFVDQILFSAFDVHLLAGLAALGGVGLLIVPAGYALRYTQHESYAVFGVTWLGIVAAAALGNYPTPLVGYGGSAILGYLLSLAALPRSAAVQQAGYPASEPRPGKGAEEINMRVGLA